MSLHGGSKRYIKNALSNLMAGGAAALLAIALPHYFVRYFSPSEFSLWVLVLQLAAYVNFLNFGVQVAVGRYVAHALETGKWREAEDIVSAAIQILSILALVGTFVVAIVAWQLPDLFHKIDPAMIGTARYILFWVGGALVLNLPATAFLGVFVGLQRNDVPAVVAAISKGALALALVVVAERTRDLRAVAQTYFAVSACGTALQYFAFKWLCRGWSLRVFSYLSASSRELILYCSSLTVWSVAMLLVNGMDTTIVGIFDFRNVAAYGSSASIVTFFVGIFTSLTNPLIQIFTKIYARGDFGALAGIFVRVSSAMSLFLFVVCWWMILPVDQVFTLWIGPELTKQAAPIFCLLIVANTIRNTGAPFSYYLLSSGQQRKVYLGPFVEGVTNLAASMILAAKFGAIGVAWGTLVGAIFGIAANYAYNFKRTMPESFSASSYFKSNMGIPFLITLPMLFVLFLGQWDVSIKLQTMAMLVAMLPALFSLLKNYRTVVR